MTTYTPLTFWQSTKENWPLAVGSIAGLIVGISFFVWQFVEFAQMHADRKEALAREIARCEALANGVPLVIERKVYCLDRALTPLHAGFYPVR